MNELQQWTVMCFFAADTNNAAGMISELKAITAAGFQADTNVLVHFDPNTNGRDFKVWDINRKRKDSPEEGPTVVGDGDRYLVRSIREDCQDITAEYIEGIKAKEKIEGKNATDKLRDFLNYTRDNFPATNYILFLVGHGMIVANDSFLPDVDDDSASSITLKQLGSVLKNFGDEVKSDKGNFQLVGFHSCSMSSIEVAYELKDSARYMIGTQGLAFPNSWPYRQILKMIFFTIEEYQALSNYDEITQEILTRIESLSFYNADDFLLAGYSADVSLCSLDGDRIEPLTQAMKALSRSLQDALKDEAAKEVILLSHWKAQSYFLENYTDLYDFCKCLAGRCDPENPTQMALQQAAIAVTDLLAVDDEHQFERLIAFSDFFGPEYQYSHGLSIYFPWAAPSDSVLTAYDTYAFQETLKPRATNGDGSEADDDSWLSFLRAYFAQTKRGARDSDRETELSVNGNGRRAVGGGVTHEGSLELPEGKPTPSLGLGEGKPTPSLGFGDGKPTPSLGFGDGKPTPSMGVSGFGFTVTKNYPAESAKKNAENPEEILSSRHRPSRVTPSPMKRGQAKGAGDR